MFTAFILYKPEGLIVSYAPSREYAQAMIDAPIGSVMYMRSPYSDSYRVKEASSLSAGYAWNTTDKQTKNVMKAFMLFHGFSTKEGQPCDTKSKKPLM